MGTIMQSLNRENIVRMLLYKKGHKRDVLSFNGHFVLNLF